MKKLLLLFIGLLFWTGSSWGQVQIGTENKDLSLPIKIQDGYSYSQMIYLKSEINTPLNINRLQFYFSTSVYFSNSNTWTIYLGHTTKSGFSSSTDWIPKASMTNVFSGLVYNNVDWMSIDLTTPFAYNNTDNLVIAIVENQPDKDNKVGFFHCTSKTGTGAEKYRSISYRSEYNLPDPANPPAANSVEYGIANVILDEVLMPPFTQGFDTFLPANWKRAKGLLAAPSTLDFTLNIFGEWAGDGFANAGTTGAARINIWGVDKKHWLITPSINLGNGTKHYRLNFDLALTDYNNSSSITTDPNGTTGTDDKFAVVISTDNGATWTSAKTLRRWDNAGSPYVYNSISNTGQNVTIDLSAYTGYVKLGFYGESTVGNADNDLFVDNITVEEIPIFAITPASNAFGTVLAGGGPAANKTLTLKNTGGGTITINTGGISITGTDANQFTLATVSYPILLAAGQSTTVNVAFAPTSAGSKTAAIKVVHNAAGSPSTAALTGTALLAGSLLQSFEGNTFPPGGWSVDDNSWIHSTTIGYDGTKSAYLYNYSSFADKKLMTPKVMVTGSESLKFYAWNYGSSNEKIQIKYSSDKVNWTNIGTEITLVTYNPTQYVVPLSIPAGTYYLAFSASSASANNTFYVDYVMGEGIYEPAASPATLVAPSIDATNVPFKPQLIWSYGSTGGTAAGYKLYLGTDGGGITTPTNFVNGTVQTSPFSPASALNYNTTYYWQVVPFNSSGDATGCPIWKFTTEIDNTLTPPFTEAFGTFPPAAWRGAIGRLANPVEFTYNSGNWTGDGFANIGTTGAARVEVRYSSVNTWLITPPINLGSGSKDYMLSFDLALTRIYNTEPAETNGTDDKFAVVISIDNGFTWSSVNTLKLWDNQGSANVFNDISNKGQKIAIDLSSYSGIVQIGFYAESTIDNANNDLFVDNVTVGEIPTCPYPADLNVSGITNSSAILNWTEFGSATSWNVKWGAAGFNPATGGTLISIINPNTTLSGLQENTTYDWYVQAACAGNEESDWVGPIPFKTKQTFATIPFAEDFETLPNQWTIINSSQTNQWHIGTATKHSGSKAAYISNNAGLSNFYDFYRKSKVHMYRDITFTGGAEKYYLSFYWKSADSYFFDFLKVYLVDIDYIPEPGIPISENNQIGTNLYQTDVPIWIFNEYELSGVSGKTKRLVFTWENYGQGGYNPAAAIDDISITTCSAPTALTTNNITAGSAELSWTQGNATKWNIKYGATGFNPATEGTLIPDLTTNTHNLSSLSSNTNYDCYVQAVCDINYNSAWVGSNTFTTLPTIPYFEGFENRNTDNTPIANWVQERVIGSDTWTANKTKTDYNRPPRTGSWNAFLKYSNTTWMFQSIPLVGGTEYTFGMYARQDGPNSTYASITVSYGTAANAISMTKPIVTQTGIINGDYQLITGTFTPETTGIYAIGILGTINGSPWYISIDDISIYETNPATATFAGTGNWSNPAKWYPGIPSATTVVTINGNVTVDNITSSCSDLTINPSGAVTVAAGKSLSIGGNLLIQSDASGTGSFIDNGTCNITGTKTIERYISGESNYWHLFSSPVAAQAIEGKFTPESGYDFYAWHEPTAYWLNQKMSGNNITSFVPGKGYLVAYQSPETKSFVGNLNSGNIAFSLNNTGTGDYKGSNLLGNPYPSSIDWKSGDLDKSKLVNNGGRSMYIYNQAYNNYGTFNDEGTTGTNDITQYIAPMQGFFVIAGSTGNFVFDNSARVHSTQNWMKSGNSNAFSLTVTAPANAGKDEILLEFGHEASKGGADKWFSMSATAPSLYATTAGKDYSIRFLTNVDDNQLVPVAFKAGVDGEYSILANFNTAAFSAKLVDKLTGNVQDLNSNPFYAFNAGTGDDANRFSLMFTTLGIDNPEAAEAIQVYAHGDVLYLATSSTEAALVNVYNLTGQLVMQGKTNGSDLTTFNASALSNGVYVVNMIFNQSVVSQKVVIRK